MRDDASYRQRLFSKAILEDLERWVELAEERLTTTGVQLYVMPGNDDPWLIDEPAPPQAAITTAISGTRRVAGGFLILLPPLGVIP